MWSPSNDLIPFNYWYFMSGLHKCMFHDLISISCSFCSLCIHVASVRQHWVSMVLRACGAFLWNFLCSVALKLWNSPRVHKENNTTSLGFLGGKIDYFLVNNKRWQLISVKTDVNAVRITITAPGVNLNLELNREMSQGIPQAWNWVIKQACCFPTLMFT